MLHKNIRHYLPKLIGKKRALSGLLCVLFTALFSGCAALRESSKYEFSSGTYKVLVRGASAFEGYVDVEEDSVVAVPISDLKGRGTERVDTAGKLIVYTPEVREQALDEVYTFSKPSFDLDVLTIPFKYRPGTSRFPQQLTTTFQGALYLGGRRDVFRLKYKPTPVGDYHRSLNHFGYSFGVFSGLGATTMNEWVTQGAIAYEYEGVVILGGVAGIIGFNNFTLGLAGGLDHLIDRNREEWIYQHKPWVGLAFGLNLN